MPWNVRVRGDEWCVYKVGEDKPVGCHASRERALAQQRALYAQEDTMTAAAAPLAPPRDWFDTPEPDQPTPLTFTEDGRVFGHLAVWGSCHTGFLNGALAECVQPPRSPSGYAHFHLGRMLTDEGDEVEVGKVTFDTSHAPLTAGMQAASRHYDDTGNVGAFVRARDGRHGIWLSGTVRSDLPPEGLRDLRANPPSGDWRAFNGSLELIASLAVPVPGFPIPRPQLALAASGSGTVEALILPGYRDVDQDGGQDWERGMEKVRSLAASLTPPRDGKAYLRRRALLAAAARQAKPGR